MWNYERLEILQEAFQWCIAHNLVPDPFNLIIAIDDLGYLRTKYEHDKWNGLKTGGEPYIVGPVDP